ncbi:hypothetical protein [Paracoccus sp. Ld10]|uniref:hypothetical protein n=1 Tax=Paracoccus sp. Ld10 TaxID=649158 RepID=UPI00386696EA
MSGCQIKGDAAYHSFDAEVAAQVRSVNAAVIYRNLVFWVRHNEANRRNFHEGRYWTYNSLAAFDEQFPYLTAKQIRTALDKLVDAGLIVKGNFAEDRFKHANWYALGETICPKGQTEVPQRSNETSALEGETSAPEGKCIKNRYKPDSKPYPRDVADTEIQAVWDAYPADRRRNRERCQHLVSKALEEVALCDLVAAASAYTAESAEFSRSLVSFLDNWLRAGRWRRNLDDVRRRREEADAEAHRQSERVASWIKSKHSMCQHLKDDHVSAAVAHGVITEREARLAGFLQ